MTLEHQQLHALIGLICSLSFILSPTTTDAHHGVSTAKAGSSGSSLSAAWPRGARRYDFETDLSYEYSTWRSEELKLGSLDTQHLRMSQRYWFTKSQALSLSIPIGHFTRYTRDEAPSSEFGLGDGSALYLFNLLNKIARSEGLSVRLFTGITIPETRC